MTEQQAIEHNAFMPRGSKCFGTVTANVTSPSGNQNSCHDWVRLG